MKGIPVKAFPGFRGPLTIVEITRRGYVCRYPSGKLYTASRNHISPETAEVPDQVAIADLDSSQPSDPAEFAPGQLIAIGDHLEAEVGNNRFN